MKAEPVAKTVCVRNIFPCPLSAATKALSSLVHQFAMGSTFFVKVEIAIRENIKQGNEDIPEVLGFKNQD